MRRYLIFACAGIGALMDSIDITMVAVAFPPLIQDFNRRSMGGMDLFDPEKGSGVLIEDLF